MLITGTAYTRVMTLQYRVTTCLENLEMSGILLAVRELSGRNLVLKKCPKTVN